MDKLDEYKIPFSGLNEGLHHFKFRLDGAFFEEFGNEELLEATFEIDMNMTKESTFMELEFHFDGTFETLCDRCMTSLSIPIKGERTVIAKVHEPTENEDILAMRPHDTVLELGRLFYESIAVELPLKRAHEEEECDPEVLERLDLYSLRESQESDPRWDALKNLGSK